MGQMLLALEGPVLLRLGCVMTCPLRFYSWLWEPLSWNGDPPNILLPLLRRDVIDRPPATNKEWL